MSSKQPLKPLLSSSKRCPTNEISLIVTRSSPVGIFSDILSPIFLKRSCLPTGDKKEIKPRSGSICSGKQMTKFSV
jgi:hypothetical protein